MKSMNQLERLIKVLTKKMFFKKNTCSVVSSLRTVETVI